MYIIIFRKTSLVEVGGRRILQVDEYHIYLYLYRVFLSWKGVGGARRLPTFLEPKWIKLDLDQS